MGMFDMIAAELSEDAAFVAALAQAEAEALAEKAAELEAVKAELEAQPVRKITKNGLNYRHDQITESGDHVSVYTVANKGVELFHVVVNNSTKLDMSDVPAAIAGRQNLVSAHPVRIVTNAGMVIETHIVAQRLRFNSGAEHIDSVELGRFVVGTLMQTIAMIKKLGGDLPPLY